MSFIKVFFFILLCLNQPYHASASSDIISLSSNPVQQRFFKAPIIYDNNFETEHERLGYRLPIEPNPISFSLDDRVYIRQKDGVAYMNDRGKWAFASFMSAISAVSGQTCSGIDLFVINDLRIVFDKDGYAYTPVLAYFGKIKRAFLLIKSPNSEQWRAYALPFGDPRMEWFSGANILDRPPAVLLYENKTISVVDVRRNQDKVSISKPQEISKNVLAIAMFSGGSIVVRSGEWIHTVFALDISPDNAEGTPEVWARWSPQKNIQYPPQLLGMSLFESPAPDEHNYPVIVADSLGRLHAVLGAHNRPFQYLYTLQSSDANEVTWTAPVVIGGKDNWVSTYPELICDSNDTLHLVARHWTREKGQFLIYSKKEPGKDWTKPLELVVPSHGGYLNCYHRLMKDSRDRLFLTYYVYFNHFTNDQMLAYHKKYPNEKLVRGESQGYGRFNYEGVERHGPYLLVSEDRGDSWRMAVEDDFKNTTVSTEYLK